MQSSLRKKGTRNCKFFEAKTYFLAPHLAQWDVKVTRVSTGDCNLMLLTNNGTQMLKYSFRSTVLRPPFQR